MRNLGSLASISSLSAFINHSLQISINMYMLCIVVLLFEILDDMTQQICPCYHYFSLRIPQMVLPAPLPLPSGLSLVMLPVRRKQNEFMEQHVSVA